MPLLVTTLPDDQEVGRRRWGKLPSASLDEPFELLQGLLNGQGLLGDGGLYPQAELYPQGFRTKWVNYSSAPVLNRT